jgi:hypothetical protein
MGEALSRQELHPAGNTDFADACDRYIPATF